METIKALFFLSSMALIPAYGGTQGTQNPDDPEKDKPARHSHMMPLKDLGNCIEQISKNVRFFRKSGKKLPESYPELLEEIGVSIGNFDLTDLSKTVPLSNTLVMMDLQKSGASLGTMSSSKAYSNLVSNPTETAELIGRIAHIFPLIIYDIQSTFPDEGAQFAILTPANTLMIGTTSGGVPTIDLDDIHSIDYHSSMDQSETLFANQEGTFRVLKIMLSSTSPKELIVSTKRRTGSYMVVNTEENLIFKERYTYGYLIQGEQKEFSLVNY